MPDIEAALEETVPILHAAQRAKLLNQSEIREVVRKRRHHEYSLARGKPKRVDFLRYAAFERDLANELSRRAKKRALKKNKVQLIVGKTSSRVNLVYSRAVRQFRHDVDLWLHYAKHCIQQGSTRTAAKVLAKALAYRSDDHRIWLAAISLHFDIIGDTRGARALAQRALRANPNSLVIWKEYFRLEMLYLSKLTTRRLQMGLGIPTKDEHASPEKNDHLPLEDEKDAQGEDQNDDIQMSDADEQDDLPVQASLKEGEDINLVSNIDSTDSESLSFWDGGVPFTIFKKALDAVPLNRTEIVAFYDITATCPFVSSQFLQAFCSVVSSRYPDCQSSKLLNLRKVWDMKYTLFNRKFPQNPEESEEKEDHLREEHYDVVEKETESTAEDLIKFLSNVQLSEMNDVQGLLIQSAQSFLDSTREFGTTKLTKSKLGDLHEYLVNLEGKQVSNTSGVDASWRSVPKEKWDLSQIHQHLSEIETEQWEADDELIEVFKSKVMTVHRNDKQHEVLTLYTSKESSLDRIRSITAIALRGSPITIDILRAAISAELRLWELRNSGTNIAARQKDEFMELQVRKLFNLAIELQSAKQDAELWLSYIDFERRIARNANSASMIHGKAQKYLSPSLLESFNEKVLLRSLKR